MKQYTLDCAAIGSREALHNALAEVLSFPGWYGKNLDALHDLLTAIGEDTTLTLLHFSSMGSFATGFRRVMEDAAKKNPHFRVTIP